MLGIPTTFWMASSRLESLILFIGSGSPSLSIKNWASYFYQAKDKKHVDFNIELSEGTGKFADLDEAVIREFREYAIPTIEISLSEDRVLSDEIITLFVDINQQGVSVNRFDIGKSDGAQG